MFWTIIEYILSWIVIGLLVELTIRFSKGWPIRADYKYYIWVAVLGPLTIFVILAGWLFDRYMDSKEEKYGEK